MNLADSIPAQALHNLLKVSIDGLLTEQILQGETAAPLQHTQGLAQQLFLAPPVVHLVIDEVADHGIEGLVLEVEMVGVALLERAAVGHLLCLGIMPAHALAIVSFDAPVVDACAMGLGITSGAADGQRTGSTTHIEQMATTVPWQT